MKKWITYIETVADLDYCLSVGVTELICSCTDLSRDTKTSKDELISILNMAQQLQVKLTLEWDIIDTENEFSKTCELFSTLPLDAVGSIRVQDLGALHYVLKHTDKPIQLIRENCDHNLKALMTWQNYIGDRCQRIILSNELNQVKIEEYAKSLTCELEILAYGKILLFYSPRNLLTPLSHKSQARTQAIGSSEESPHSGFPLVENTHGTFMYHIKDLFLLDKLDDLQSLSVSCLRVDLRGKDLKLLEKIIKLENSVQGNELKLSLGQKFTRGYFQTNKTDVLFKKLKNHRVQRKDEQYVGEVVEIQNKEYMALLVRDKTVSLNDKLRIISPDGKEYNTHLASLRNTNFVDCEEISKGQIAILKYKGGVWPKSQVYLE